MSSLTFTPNGRQLSGRRAIQVRDAEDVGDIAYELTKARIASSGPQQLLVEMEVFFVGPASAIGFPSPREC